MTALNYMLSSDAVCITMDTLASRSDDKTPFIFTSKIFPVPHLNGVICGTGISNFILDWFVFVNSSCLVKDMINLDLYTPEQLNLLFSKYQENKEINQPRSTIYHFGYDVTKREFAGFAYRSEKCFVSEQLIFSIGMKPEPSFIKKGEIPELNGLPDAFIKIMKIQKEEDEKFLGDEKVGVGGDIHFFYMSKNQSSEDCLPILMQIQHCHRFSDYENMYAQMLKNVNR